MNILFRGVLNKMNSTSGEKLKHTKGWDLQTGKSLKYQVKCEGVDRAIGLVV